MQYTPLMKSQKDEKIPRKSRRAFLSLGLLGGASVIVQGAHAQTPPEDGEMIRMLTPDGKLVEVPKRSVDSSEQKHKARNADILDWTQSNQKSE
jgi:hypothetical protein